MRNALIPKRDNLEEKLFKSTFRFSPIILCVNSRRLQNFCTHSSIQLVRKHAKCVGTPFWRLSAIFTLISKLVVYQAVLMHKYNRRTPCTLSYGGLIFIFYFILINDALLSPVPDWWSEPIICYCTIMKLIDLQKTK